MIKNIEVYKSIYHTALFEGVTYEEFESIIKDIFFRKKKYSKGEIVGGDNDEHNAIGIVVDGKIHAMKYLLSGKNSFLKKMGKGDIFGVGNVFREKDIRLSYMEVIEDAKVIYITEKELMKLFKEEKILMNYLKFINSKIQYLNKKIDVISQTSSKDKVLLYLNDCSLLQDRTNTIKLPLSKQGIAEYLGISRATFYRVLDELVAEHMIEYEGNRVHIKYILTKERRR